MKERKQVFYECTMFMAMFTQGFLLTASLIASIGSQSTFVLSQGIRRRHHHTAAGVSSLCDAVLVSLGIGGLGALQARHPLVRDVAIIGGAAFLIWYGATAMGAAIRGRSFESSRSGGASRRAVVLSTLAIAFLNPHVYLDTLILIPSLSTGLSGVEKIFYGLGSVSASFLWFFSLSTLGSRLAPWLARSSVRRWVNGITAVVLWMMAARLLS